MKLRPLLVSVVLLTLAFDFDCSAQDAGPSPAATPAPKIIVTRFDSLEKSPPGYEEETLDAFAKALRSNPGQTGHVVVYDGRRSCKGEAQRRAESIREYLVTRRGVSWERVVLRVGGHMDRPHVLLLMQPNGVTPVHPEPLPVEGVEEVDYEVAAAEGKAEGDTREQAPGQGPRGG